VVTLAAGFNQGAVIAAEPGAVVIGGVISSAFLTPLVFAAIYSLVDGLGRRVTGWFSRPKADDGAPVRATTATD
jgi:Cu/Ag efflux pump CusA